MHIKLGICISEVGSSILSLLQGKSKWSIIFECREDNEFLLLLKNESSEWVMRTKLYYCWTSQIIHLQSFAWAFNTRGIGYSG
jgi:deoxyadenosine/deoxycytidine kinase